MSGKFALLIGNTEYTDPGLAQLTAPGKDTEDFAHVLKAREICAFDDVNLLLNQPEHIVRGAIDEFFDQKKPDDLLVLYFSGHGVRDDVGALYLAVKNTIRNRLRSTAIKSDYIREAMDQSRSKRQVLILDCCNSGAFAQGTKAATGISIGTATAFEAGYGRIILTASDSTQFAWEGEKVIGETDNSLFTHFLVEGLEGEADLDSDGRITVDNLYDYVYEKVKLATPKQTPSKFSSRQQGEIVLRQITRIEDIKPVSLPDELIEASDDSRTFVREGAVQQLEKLLKGKNLGLARSAREVLERIEKNDDSRRVSQAATQALAAIRQAEAEKEEEGKGERSLAQQKSEEERKAREAANQIALQKANEERSAREKAETERLAKQKAEAEKKRRDDLRVEQKARVIANAQKVLSTLRAIFSVKAQKGKLKVGYLAISMATLFLIAWISWPQFIYASSKSIDQQEISFPVVKKIRIKDNIDYSASSLLLKGILMEIEIKAPKALKDVPCEVIVYFNQPNGNPLTASRNFATMLSPYISRGNYVSVYANTTPLYENSNLNVRLFIPYAAFANSGLPEGSSHISFYADIYRVSDRSLIARSSSTQFTYTR